MPMKLNSSFNYRDRIRNARQHRPKFFTRPVLGSKPNNPVRKVSRPRPVKQSKANSPTHFEKPLSSGVQTPQVCREQGHRMPTVAYLPRRGLLKSHDHGEPHKTLIDI